MKTDDVVIKVENISKRYRIGLKSELNENFLGTFWDFVKSPLRNYYKYRSLYKFDDKTAGGDFAESPDILWALRDVSFEVKRGELLGLVGSNGSGKSTLLKVLSQITAPTYGVAGIRGRVSSLLEVGTGFHPELSGRDNVYLNGSVLGMKKTEIDRKFDAIVDFSGVEKFIDTPVKRYSSGMTVRLAFAVAAHLEPEIMTVDEVLAVGDAAFQKKCLDKMDNVAKAGRTIMFVSHNMAAVESLCSRAIWIDKGRVLDVGDPKEIIAKYLQVQTEKTEIDLSDRVDRGGDGRIFLHQIRMFDALDHSVDYAVTGSLVKFRLYYTCQTPKKYMNCRFSIAITKQEQVYMMLSTELVSKEQLDINGEGFIDFIIPKFTLTEDIYDVTVFVESDKVIADWIKNAVRLKVVDGDYYGTGRNFPTGDFKGKYTLVDFFWENTKQ